jgi:hypothetical protein
MTTIYFSAPLRLAMLGPCLALAALFMLAPGVLTSAYAEVAATSPASVPEAELTPEEKAERESRKACKAAVCAGFRNRTPGADVACEITKSFRKEQLNKIVGKAKVSWPWGKVVCKASIKAKRDTLMKAMTEDKLQAEFETHKVACQVEREKDAAADITAEMTPKVTFEKGKAVKASLNWGKVEGPTVIKGAMWTATATDNTVNVLGKMIVDDINDFVTKKCDEIKPEWDGK